VSDDGIDFKKPDNVQFSDIEPYMGRKTRIRPHEGGYSGRYIKVLIKNYGIIPQGNPGAGSRAWLFVDEIEVK
jgi:hexosaminidase